MMELAPSVRAFFERLHQMRSVEFLLKRLALFQGVGSSDFYELSRRVQLRNYERG